MCHVFTQKTPTHEYAIVSICNSWENTLIVKNALAVKPTKPTLTAEDEKSC